jgi:hypothetical protein
MEPIANPACGGVHLFPGVDVLQGGETPGRVQALLVKETVQGADGDALGIARPTVLLGAMAHLALFGLPDLMKLAFKTGS